MTRRPRRGISLVEMLTVILLLTILMAILFPAFQMAREAARLSTCVDRQKQISLAILGYETHKNHLPPLLAQMPNINPPIYYNWVEAILPDLEHTDIWDQIRSSPSGFVPNESVQILSCPDDPMLQNFATVKPQMSYVVNNQWFLNYLTQPPTNIVTGTQQTPTIISKLSTATTVMLAENTPKTGTPKTWSTDGQTPPWKAPAGALQAGILTFTPPLPSPPNPPTLIGNLPTIASQHGGTVVVSFFDGHQQKLKADENFPSP